MRKQYICKGFLKKYIFILTFISNVNADNTLFHTVIDASALAVGNALTGAQFSHDSGIINPARINQFKPGTLLFSSESQFSGTFYRQIFSYRGRSLPFRLLFLHEGIHDIPDTRYALNDWNGDELLNGNERLIQIRYPILVNIVLVS